MMGLQLVFVVETNKKCNSDWIYIKATIEHFYEYERTKVKLSIWMERETIKAKNERWRSLSDSMVPCQK